MHRLNLTIDESLYEKARAFSFLEIFLFLQSSQKKMKYLRI